MEGTKVTSLCKMAALVGTLLYAGCGADKVDQAASMHGTEAMVAGGAAGTSAQPTTLSPYANQAPSPIRSLSAQEYDDLQNGRGTGMARAAELNSYPGPRHALDLRAQLQLDDAVAGKIEALYMQMDRDARQIGAEVLSKEQMLNQAFERATVTEEQVATQIEELGALYGQLRGVHLRAHVAVRQLLTPAQILTYNELRGYAASGSHASHHQ